MQQCRLRYVRLAPSQALTSVCMESTDPDDLCACTQGCTTGYLLLLALLGQSDFSWRARLASSSSRPWIRVSKRSRILQQIAVPNRPGALSGQPLRHIMPACLLSFSLQYRPLVPICNLTKGTSSGFVCTCRAGKRSCLVMDRATHTAV